MKFEPPGAAGITYTIPNVKMVIWPYLRQARLKNDIRQKQPTA